MIFFSGCEVLISRTSDFKDFLISTFQLSCPITELYRCFNLLFQLTFQTLQLSAEAKIDTNNPELFIIGENTLTVSDS